MGMRPIRVLALMEAQTLSGPAKNLIQFAKIASRPTGELPGVEVRIATFQRIRARADFIKAIESAGLTVSVIPEKGVLDRTILAGLREISDEFEADIVQTHNVKSHFLVRVLGLHRVYPWIAFHHGYTTTDAKMRLYNQLNWYSLRSADLVVAVCQAFVNQVVRTGVPGERIVVQHNMITPFVPSPSSQRDAVRLSLGVKGKTRVILCVGRLSREKGHADLIRAVAKIRKISTALDFRIVLVGEGVERERIEQLSIRCGVRDLITFAGHQSDLAAYYSIADIFVLPSHSEGSPNALLEALAAGVPTVATSVGGVPEIAVHEQNALLIPKGDSEGMSEAIVRLLTDSALCAKLIDCGRKVTERHTTELYRQSMVRMYERVLRYRSGDAPTEM
jgi:glycosyltransferase involved in cell wall biosynthesis